MLRGERVDNVADGGVRTVDHSASEHSVAHGSMCVLRCVTLSWSQTVAPRSVRDAPCRLIRIHGANQGEGARKRGSQVARHDFGVAAAQHVAGIPAGNDETKRGPADAVPVERGR